MTDTERGLGSVPRFSVGVSLVSVLAVSGLVAPLLVPVGTAALGGLVIAVGLYRRAFLWLGVGTSGLFVAVVIAGTERSPAWSLAATVPVVLAWLSARYAVRLGQQVGHETATRRIELVHTISTVTVLGVGGTLSYMVARSVGGTSSPLAVALLLIAVVAFTVTLVAES